MKKTKIFFVLLFVILCCVWLTFGNVFTLNFMFAFLSFLIIVLGVFYTQKQKILKLINGASKEELEALAETYKSKQEKQEEEQEEFFMESKMDSNALQSESWNCNLTNTQSLSLANIKPKENTNKTTKTMDSKKRHSFFASLTKNLFPQKSQKSPQHYQQNTQEIPLKKRKFLDNFSAINVKTGAKIFFLPLRLLTYGILIVGILILIRHELFDTLAFFSGLAFANLVLILGIVFGMFRQQVKLT
ncbi:hypothetical protein [Helicobacter sp.]|uniref:hypothetical protein n=1 Tax=Helicobacter sp. TaxID=218 RepID=UPI0025C59D01|nr:hypothetical protein [Helicobacter sp.]MCI5968744.1 hypothetical protein [Helicobacter sp.]MDY2584568.1 hypothetical protein [Helicobacter sp.]